MSRSILRWLFCLLLCSRQNTVWGGEEAPIIVQNASCRLVISPEGKALSLWDKVSGTECLQAGIEIPIFTLTQYTAYSNELQLMLPAGPRTFRVRAVRRQGDRLEARFEQVNIVAFLRLRITKDYLAFTLDSISYDGLTMGDQRPTQVDELTILQLPVRDRGHFGEWLNVSWDANTAVNLLAADPYARISSVAERGYHLMQATAVASVRLLPVTAALLTCPQPQLMDHLAALEENFGLPPGVASRRNPAYRYSYLELKKVTPQNIGQYIQFAKAAGLHAIQVLWSDFASSAGHFPFRTAYPRGIEDLKAVVDSIRSAGLLAGLHIHYTKASKDDPYVSPVPDYRLNLREQFTLAAPLAKSDTCVWIEEDPSRSTLDEGRRILRIGQELLQYDSFTTRRPYRFTGCRRGLLGSKPGSYERGMSLGLLDVDTWNIFVRFDQRTGIQQEVADRIGQLYREAGFSFLYFDGAEDVPPPYWYNTSSAQLILYRSLRSPLLFAEGALKSHFSWHLLSRANAFDIFEPAVLKKAIDYFPLREAAMLEDDFSSVNFGWLDYALPAGASGGLQPDLLEYACSRAAAYDSPVSLLAGLQELQLHPRTPDNLEVLRRWEEAKLMGWFTEDQLRMMRQPGSEVTLLRNHNKGFLLCPVMPLRLGDPKLPLKAYLFDLHGKTAVLFWHLTGSADFVLPLPVGKLQLYQESSQESIPVRTCPGGVLLPAAGRRILVTALAREEVIRAFQQVK
ncbi:MAG TPA: hypothetical protein VFS31_15030 [Chitinophagaceae bacterium]|jgi:hypothetical protein|nr:hypothetical protein [Chitinophagaceae bacterium]